jgi:hypothetical protein
MKIFTKQLLLALTLFVFTNCKKQLDFTYVEGIAQDYYTKQPIANATMCILGPGSIKESFTTTDVNGRFEFERFRALKGISLEYYVGIEGNAYQVSSIKGKNMIVKGKKNNLTPIIIKPCNVIFKIIDSTDVYDPNVKVCYKIDGSKEVILETRNDYQCFFNSVINSQSNIISRGVDLPYTWKVTRNNVEQNYNGFIKIEKDTIIDIVY